MQQVTYELELGLFFYDIKDGTESYYTLNYTIRMILPSSTDKTTIGTWSVRIVTNLYSILINVDLNVLPVCTTPNEDTPVFCTA